MPGAVRLPRHGASKEKHENSGRRSDIQVRGPYAQDEDDVGDLICTWPMASVDQRKPRTLRQTGFSASSTQKHHE